MADDWNSRQKLAFWVRLIGVAIPLAFGMATAGISIGKWFWTRASTRDIAALEERKEDKAHAAEQRRRIMTRIDIMQPVLGNVRDNLLILMDRQRAKPKPLPAHLQTGLMEEIEK